MIHVIVVAVLMTLVVVPALIAAVSVPNHLRAAGWERNPRHTLDRRCQPDPIEREALRLARQEVAEIEWQAGLIPKPAHLREANQRNARDVIPLLLQGSPQQMRRLLPPTDAQIDSDIGYRDDQTQRTISVPPPLIEDRVIARKMNGQIAYDSWWPCP